MVKPLAFPIALRNIDRLVGPKFQTGEICDRFIRLSAALLMALTFVADPADSWAHGSAPAVLDVLSDDEDASRIRLTVGLAEATDDGWRWACPAAWGGPETPVVANTDSGMVLFGDAGAVQVRDGAGVIVDGGADLDAASVRAAAAAEETVFVLARIEGEDSLMSVSTETVSTIAQLQDTWQSLDVREGSPVLGAVRDGRLVVSELRPEGTGLSEQAYDLELPEGASARLRIRGSQSFAVISSDGDYRLFDLGEREATELFASSSFIHGPMPVGESILAVSDGALWELGDNARVLDDRVRYTCASWSPTASFVCAQTALFRVYDGGAATIPTFQHADLRPPLEPTGSCQAEWLDYAGHAGIDLGVETEENPGPNGESSEDPAPKTGCSTSGSSPTAPLLFMLVALSARRRSPHR